MGRPTNRKPDRFGLRPKGSVPTADRTVRIPLPTRFQSENNDTPTHINFALACSNFSHHAASGLKSEDNRHNRANETPPLVVKPELDNTPTFVGLSSGAALDRLRALLPTAAKQFPTLKMMQIFYHITMYDVIILEGSSIKEGNRNEIHCAENNESKLGSFPCRPHAYRLAPVRMLHACRRTPERTRARRIA